MKVQRACLVGLMMTLIVGMTGCATILNDKTQKINVTSSTGEKFAFSIDGQSYEGPAIVDVTRTKADKFIVAESPNCNKQTLLPAKVDNKFWINILTGGVFGSTTDYSTEEMWGYDSNAVVSCTKE
ncbi:MAG: adenosine deaminase [Gammaproteobacteria bacterium]